MDPQQAWLDLEFYLAHEGWDSEALDCTEGLLSWVGRPFGLPPAQAIQEGFTRESFLLYLERMIRVLREYDALACNADKEGECSSSPC